MYITITDIVRKKRINLPYVIQNLDSSKEFAVVSMFSNNTQYKMKEPLKVLPITNKEKQLLEGVFTGRELNTSAGRTLITTPPNANDNTIKTNKLACLLEMVLSLDELDNTDN